MYFKVVYLFALLGFPSLGGEVWLQGLLAGARRNMVVLSTGDSCWCGWSLQAETLARYVSWSCEERAGTPKFQPKLCATILSLYLRFCRGSKALTESAEQGKSQIETSLVMFEPRGLSRCLLPLTSRRMRKGTARFEPCICLGVRPATRPACIFAVAPRKWQKKLCFCT